MTLGACRHQPLARRVGSSPTPTRAGPGSRPPPPSSPSSGRSPPGPPPSSSTSTPPPTASWWSATTPPSTGPPTAGAHRRPDAGRAARPSTTPTGSSPEPTSRPGRPPSRVPLPGPGRRRPRLPDRHAARGARALPRRGAQPRHQADRAGGRPLRGDAGRLLAEYGRTDDVIVASFLDPATEAFAAAAPDVRHLGRDPGHRRVLAGRADGQRAARPAGRGLPGARAPRGPGGGRRGLRRGGPPARLAVHVWTVNDAEAMERLVDLGVDGIISDLPTTLSGVLRRSRRRLGAGCPGRREPGAPRLSRARSSASCRGWPSSWPAACASPFAST